MTRIASAQPSGDLIKSQRIRQTAKPQRPQQESVFKALLKQKMTEGKERG